MTLILLNDPIEASSSIEALKESDFSTYQMILSNFRLANHFQVRPVLGRLYRTVTFDCLKLGQAKGIR